MTTQAGGPAGMRRGVAILSRMPWHSGDGYCWGGDWIVTVGDRSINLGDGEHAQELGERIVAALNAASAVTPTPTGEA